MLHDLPVNVTESLTPHVCLTDTAALPPTQIPVTKVSLDTRILEPKENDSSIDALFSLSNYGLFLARGVKIDRGILY